MQGFRLQTRQRLEEATGARFLVVVEEPGANLQIKKKKGEIFLQRLNWIQEEWVKLLVHCIPLYSFLFVKHLGCVDQLMQGLLNKKEEDEDGDY